MARAMGEEPTLWKKPFVKSVAVIFTGFLRLFPPFKQREEFVFHKIRPSGGERATGDPMSYVLERENAADGASTYTPQHIANFFLEKARLEGTTLDQLKLMKLVYIAYGWVLALTGSRLFDEPIEAWRHGPVIESIYHEFKDFGRRPITRDAIDIDLDTWESSVPTIPEQDSRTRAILDRVWGAYRRFSGWALREKTHERDGPWERVYRENVNERIRDEDIREHYRRRIREYLRIAASQ